MVNTVATLLTQDCQAKGKEMEMKWKQKTALQKQDMWLIINSTKVFIERFLPICGQNFLGAHYASFGTNTPRERAAQTYWNTNECLASAVPPSPLVK